MHLSKFILSPIGKFFNKYPEAIQAISAVIIALLTINTLLFNSALLKQQKREEIIQYRPYISVIGPTLIRPSLEKPQLPTAGDFAFEIENNGKTPARDVRFFYSSASGVRFGSKRKNSIIGPSQKNIFTSAVDDITTEFNLIRNGNNKFFTLEIQYYDYARNCYRYLGKFVSIVGNSSALSVWQESDEKC